jgi:hypothetical protein
MVHALTREHADRAGPLHGLDGHLVCMPVNRSVPTPIFNNVCCLKLVLESFQLGNSTIEGWSLESTSGVPGPFGMFTKPRLHGGFCQQKRGHRNTDSKIAPGL